MKKKKNKNKKGVLSVGILLNLKIIKGISEDAIKKKIGTSKVLLEKRTVPEPVEAKEAAMGRASAMESAPSAAGGKRSASSMLRHWLEEDYRPAAKLPKPGDFPVEETFTQRLLRFMKEKNMDSPEVYTEARSGWLWR